MPRVTGIKQISVGFGSGAADPQPKRIPIPTCGSPDRVEPNNQRNMNLKDGIKGPTKSHNPGKK
jgi:hypothetical protein